MLAKYTGPNTIVAAEKAPVAEKPQRMAGIRRSLTKPLKPVFMTSEHKQASMHSSPLAYTQQAKISKNELHRALVSFFGDSYLRKVSEVDSISVYEARFQMQLLGKCKLLVVTIENDGTPVSHQRQLRNLLNWNSVQLRYRKITDATKLLPIVEEHSTDDKILDQSMTKVDTKDKIISYAFASNIRVELIASNVSKVYPDTATLKQGLMASEISILEI